MGLPVLNPLTEMKRRRTKKVLRRTEQYLAGALRDFLIESDGRGATNENSLLKLNSEITYLCGMRLRLSRLWDHKHRWIDDCEWTLMRRSALGLEGTGQIWWGNRLNVSGAITPIEFEGSLRLLSAMPRLRLSYRLSFTENGVTFCICSADQRR